MGRIDGGCHPMNLILVESRDVVRAGLQKLLEAQGHAVTALQGAETASPTLLEGADMVLVGAADAPQCGRIVYLPAGYETQPFAATAAFLLDAGTGMGPAELSRREYDVLRLLAAGMSNRQISETLHLSEKTVKHYLTGLFRKLDVSNRGAAISWYFLQNTTKV